jgi:hypothetical protein
VVLSACSKELAWYVCRDWAKDDFSLFERAMLGLAGRGLVHDEGDAFRLDEASLRASESFSASLPAAPRDVSNSTDPSVWALLVRCRPSHTSYLHLHVSSNMTHLASIMSYFIDYNKKEIEVSAEPDDSEQR